MCLECGCGTGGEVRVGVTGAHGQSDRGEGRHGSSAAPPKHEPQHSHQQHSHHQSTATHEHPTRSRTIAIHQDVLAKNDHLAARNRESFKAKGLLVLNVVSSPGSGKTTLIQKTAESLAGKVRVGVIVGDLATDNDAARLRQAKVPVVQITTGTVCHLDAEMIARATSQLNLDVLDVLVIENVGNLVCPAVYDLGEDLRVVLLSSTEGEDKPLKYPPMFHSADVAIVTKRDLAAAAGFDREQALRNLREISHHAAIFEVSARTGEGMGAWREFLIEKRAAVLRSDA